MCLILFATFLSLNSRHRAEWPEKPIRMISPFVAGGAACQKAAVCGRLERAFAQQFVVENRTGRRAISADVARATLTLHPDGRRHVVARARARHQQEPGFDPTIFTHIAFFGGARSPPCIPARRLVVQGAARLGEAARRRRIRLVGTGTVATCSLNTSPSRSGSS